MTTTILPPKRRVQTFEIRGALPILRLLEMDGVTMSRAGQSFLGLCPFHREGSPSFTWSRSRPNTVHCFGCGWHGDIFKYWMARTGLDFAGASGALAVMAGFADENLAGTRSRLLKKATPLTCVPRKQKKPRLPELRNGTEAELEELAGLRGLNVVTLRVAEALGLLRFALWPDWRADAARCWVITDNARWVAQFRRLDGALFQWSEERTIKAWTKGSPSWPVGAARLGPRAVRNVLVVEGGPDLLAAIELLSVFGMLGQVAPVAMLGASCNVSDAALAIVDVGAANHARRVRVCPHADEAGAKSVQRWKQLLTGANCRVAEFRLPSLDGVKDLNDLVRQPRAVWDTREVRRAFMNWDF